MNRTRVLLTGFDPFHDDPVNAAWEVVQEVAASDLAGIDLHVQQIPTVFHTSLDVLAQAIRQVQPDVVLCLGQAGGRAAISIERIGVNLDDARIPDNAGQQPREVPIVAGGPAAYWSGLPVRDLVTRLREAGIPAEESWSAGHFVCNHVLYGLMHLLQAPEFQTQGVVGGFIHVPYLPEQAARHPNTPCLGRAEMVRALRLVLDALKR
ncbi:pyroglutamyl-peptidase I [Alicyclobacillus cycloheptanicus]|uniref:Pyrrolidone-carboxylate peptidase n=1 Tax=Alicyclobacillus cycloheptanicus TaxID=1457 RepID=A0ABT9XEG3_9BACL|nr:pyroglutamyl-peptidase I [Alicyclobacillus cycloheptanicus]MDQ0188670.1 pyroglutamyl-peptidase [Alicyclobacillus cycloheptanicus]WDM00658.1 pyroglutamyl-peptidase I [Alicyclobacillus cycloheptanicus]